MNSGLRILLCLSGALCLISAPAASAGRLGWNETAKIDRVAVMSYQVQSLSIGKSKWSARISFRNLSHKTIRIGSGFGVSFYGDRTTDTLSGALGFATATSFSSPVPKSLKPGGAWTGVISGDGSLSAEGNVYARVVFGPFSGLPGESKAVVWVTDHATTVTTASSGSGSGGTAI